MASSLALIYKGTKLDSESMLEWKKEYDKLTEADKAELKEEAEKYSV